jgi:transposase
VRKYLAADAFPERGRHSVPPSILAPYQGHLNARWAEGARSALGLWREIQALGYTGSSRPVSIWAQGRRTEPHPCTPKKYLAETAHAEGALPRRGRLPSTRRLAWLLVCDPEDLSDAEAVVLAHVRQDAEVAALHDLARSYTRMIREKRLERLDSWLVACRTSRIAALVSFGEGLHHDYAAVRAALVEPWSSGQAEGQINELIDQPTEDAQTSDVRPGRLRAAPQARSVRRVSTQSAGDSPKRGNSRSLFQSCSP